MKAVAKSRWRYAQAKEIAYQRNKIDRFANKTESLQEIGRAKTKRVLQLLDRLGVGTNSESVVLEIGSGAHGLIWNWPTNHPIGLDPLAHFYQAALDFHESGAVHSIQAMGEQIPLKSNAVDLVVTENVLDHTRDPSTILTEISRVIKPGGVLYCLVDVHHWVWALGARVYNKLFSIGFRLSIPAYPHHPFHFRREEFLSLIKTNRFDLLSTVTYEPGEFSPKIDHPVSWRYALKTKFPKNVGLEIVAIAR